MVLANREICLARSHGRFGKLNVTAGTVRIENSLDVLQRVI